MILFWINCIEWNFTEKSAVPGVLIWNTSFDELEINFNDFALK